MLKKFVSIFGGDPNRRTIDKYSNTVGHINQLEQRFEELSDEALHQLTGEYRARLAEGETLDDILPEAFAAVREASKRTLGMRHYDVQLIGGIALHQGNIAEMRTGEGKTLVATLPLYLNALTGKGNHLVTVNDYLARRDARWMAPVYNALGLTVGVLQMAARTENGKKAFVVDLERTSPHEDQNQLRMVPRAEAYAADVTYGTNSEFGFDYLRDNMTMRLDERVQRGFHYAIIDEVDNVLIDEARTPLIISGPAQEDTGWYDRMAQVVRQLRPEDYEISERDRSVTLTEIGETRVEELLGIPLRDPDRPEDVTPEQARLLGYLEQALRAQHLFRRNKDYLVQGGKVIIVDEFTGRLMPGRRWSDGLHQAVEAKEGVRVQAENVTYATVTIQNYFRMYSKLAGMSGTALTEAEEFFKIYKLEVVAIPTNLEYQASLPDSQLVELEGRDEMGYKYRYYAWKNESQSSPVYWKRKDYPDVVYRSEEAKFRAIAMEILRYHVMGRPMLVGTTSVELSDRLSSRLKAEPLRRLAQVLLLRHTWMHKNGREEDGRLVPELEFLYKSLEDLDISDMRKMARELELSFNPQDAENMPRLLDILGLENQDQARLVGCLQAGIPHQVLNARKHTEESQIIAGAGAFGAVTIATNMAGRGVDIKLGGELSERLIANVNRVLHRAGYEGPYDMRMEQRRQALLELDPAEYGIYGAEVRQFLQNMDDMERVKHLGGLHVIGSERHEARRIDNQLRGRAARQGDPGSSRFYLSMEDDLMRRFGGQQADGLMQRLRIDDAMPLEMGLVSRIIEQSQTRVEGANFDVRKHLLEYDDVLNSQRTKIYAQRDRIFTKEDLSEDISEMLQVEVTQRIPQALKDEEGPWKLLAWMEQIQPPLSFNGAIFPSYPLRLLLDYLHSQSGALDTPQKVIEALVSLAREALIAEDEHLLRTVHTLLDNIRDRLETQLNERLEIVDTFFEGFNLEEEEDDGIGPRNGRDIVDELSSLLHIPLRLSPEGLRLLRANGDRDALDEVIAEVRSQVEATLHTQAMTRLIAAIDRRLEDSFEIAPAQLPSDDWDALEDFILSAIESILERRHERLLGNGASPSPDAQPTGGQVAKDLESALSKISGPLTTDHLIALLVMMPQGARATFDKKTHRRVWQRTTRLTFTFFVARFLENRIPEEIAVEVLEHLHQAQLAIQRAWGLSSWSQLAAASWDDLDARVQNGLLAVLGEEKCRALQSQPLQSLAKDDVLQVIDELGRRSLTVVYRGLLLGVITELWVDYLTQMEGLRVAIGLEAYAQRDPLVQYKSRASELFQALFSNMRLGVITRMFTYQPRGAASAPLGLRRASVARESEEPTKPLEIPAQEVPGEASAVEAGIERPTDPQPAGKGEGELTRSQRRRRRRR